ncbi:TspO/MBR family protein [Kribbella deserti]|uniref:TspO/MBR family protein n=1 Tax=Kribbella deserti TaxID=1926257 RepID=A0ABV6QHA2_9ACTN
MTTWTEHRPLRSALALGVLAAAVTAAALIGVLAVSNTAGQYADLRQPGWAPPSWLFGPVWTVLYAMIALSGWLVWQRTGWSRDLVPFGVQLVLNAAWTPLFFGLAARGPALIDIIALWLAIAWTVLTFHRIRPLAAALLLPYWAWTTFALALNATLWHLNR